MNQFYEVHTIGGLGDLGAPEPLSATSPVVRGIQLFGLGLSFPVLGAIAVVVAGTLVYVLHKRSLAK